MRTPDTTYDVEDYELMVAGELSNGGFIFDEPRKLSLIFACKPFKQSATDLQLSLDFGNKQEVELYLNKECDSMQTVQEYFTVLYVVYWIIIILIALLVVAVVLHYLQTNELSFTDVISYGKKYSLTMLDWAQEKYYEFRYPETDKKHFVQLDKFVEPDTLDIQISSPSSHEKLEKADYGGL